MGRIEIQVITEEQYLAINGASRLGIGDSALHKNKGNNSDKTWKKLVDNQLRKDLELVERRDQLRKEYWAKVEAGELRPPTRIESLISTANGHPDNEATKAARILLERRNISWIQN